MRSLCLPPHGCARRYDPWHWHEELEVIFVAAGTLKLQIPGGEYLLQEGSLVVLNSNVLHSLSGHPAGALRSMVFSPFLITGGADTVFYKNYVRALLACPDFFRLAGGAGPGRQAVFGRLFLPWRRTRLRMNLPSGRTLSQLLLHCYAQLLPRLSAQKPAKSADTVRIEQMLQYMQASYAEPITLADIAQAARLSERECLRCFHRTIGDSPVQYLLKYRLMQGAALLRASPAASIAEVSAACGFDSPSYFSKQFRRFYQRPPREYRTAGQ